MRQFHPDVATPIQFSIRGQHAPTDADHPIAHLRFSAPSARQLRGHQKLCPLRRGRESHPSPQRPLLQQADPGRPQHPKRFRSQNTVPLRCKCSQSQLHLRQAKGWKRRFPLCLHRRIKRHIQGRCPKGQRKCRCQRPDYRRFGFVCDCGPTPRHRQGPHSALPHCLQISGQDSPPHLHSNHWQSRMPRRGCHADRDRCYTGSSACRDQGRCAHRRLASSSLQYSIHGQRPRWCPSAGVVSAAIRGSWQIGNCENRQSGYERRHRPQPKGRIHGKPHPPFC
jgi:hypothetical protein